MVLSHSVALIKMYLFGLLCQKINHHIDVDANKIQIIDRSSENRIATFMILQLVDRKVYKRYIYEK